MGTNRRPDPSFLFLATCLACLVVLAENAHAQDSEPHFEARVDREELFENETLSLEVLYAERADTDAIDFEALLSDFTILGIRPTSQTRIENFRRSSQTSWQLTLMPKRVGTLRIPAFSIGKARTRPLQVRVTAARSSPEQGAPLAAELSIDRERFFVGEQILIRITLTADRSVGDLRGVPPELPDTEMTLVSQREFRRIVSGVPYQVNELVYAAFPQTPGIIELPALQYTGSLRRSRLVVARTEPRTIEILDPAQHPEAGRKQPWFPASGVALGSEWGSDVDTLRVGEPITRTIQITAAGQRAAAISPLSLPTGSYKQYAEQPVLTDSETSTGILGSRSQSIVIVPTEAGELRLPPIEIDWWDVEARLWKVARLPGETLRVARNDSLAAPTAPPIGQLGDTPPLPGTTEPGVRQDILVGALGLLTLICVLLLGCCVWLLRRLRRLEAVSNETVQAGAALHEDSQNEARAFDQALRSIAECDPASTRRDLLVWARARWPDAGITRLEQLRDVTSDTTWPTLLAALDGALYRDPRQVDPIDYTELGRLIEAIRKETGTGAAVRPSRLPELYPS